MALTLTVTVLPGYIAEAGKKIYVEDLNKGFLPTVKIIGLVGPGDIADGAVRINHLDPGLLASAQVASTVAGTDLLLLGVSAGTANRSATVDALLSGMWTSPAVVSQFDDWASDRWLFQNEDGVVRAMAPAGLASSLVRQAPVASALGDYAANLVGVNGTSGATAMKVADFAKALITQAPAFISPEALSIGDEVLVHDVSTGKVSKTTISELVAVRTMQVRNIVLPTTYNTKAGETAHAFGATPTVIGASLECTAPAGDAGYSQGDVIPSSMVHSSVTGGDSPAYAPIASASTIYLLFVGQAGGSVIVPHKTTGAYSTTFTPAAWRAHLYASK